MKNIKIATITPTRNERSSLLNFCKKQIQNQTLKPNFSIIIDDEPKSNNNDMVYRYKKGLYYIKDKCDLIFFIEDDDYYDNDYIMKMTRYWIENGRPDIMGLDYTYYYHLKYKKYLKIDHNNRASLFTTCISNKFIGNVLNVSNNVRHLDTALWSIENVNKKTIATNNIIAIGVKHGIGLCGGKGHSDMFKYKNNDFDMSWLQTNTNKEAFNFYKSINYK